MTVSPPYATIGYLPQEPERCPDETVRQFLARRTGVAAADEAMQAAVDALAAGMPDTDEDYFRAWSAGSRSVGRTWMSDRAGAGRGIPARTGRRAASRPGGLRRVRGHRRGLRLAMYPGHGEDKALHGNVR